VPPRLHKVKLGRTTNTGLPPGNAAGTASLASSASGADADAADDDDPMNMSTIGVDMTGSNGNATDGDVTTRRDDAAAATVSNNAPADVGPLLPTELVSEFLTQSGSLVVGDFVISKSRDQVASKPQAGAAAADRFADAEGDDAMSRSDGGGEAIASRAKTSDELATLSHATRERSSSGTTAHAWAEPSAWSPATRALQEECASSPLPECCVARACRGSDASLSPSGRT
jgi:hypothetical protein